MGGIPVQASVGLIFGQVELLILGVDRNRFMPEDSQCVSDLRRIAAKRIAFPDPAVIGFLARQPGLPWCMPTGAIAVGMLQDRVRIDNVTGGIEAQRTDATGLIIQLAIGHINPAAILGCKSSAAIGCGVPGIAKYFLTGAGDDARSKSCG